MEAVGDIVQNWRSAFSQGHLTSASVSEYLKTAALELVETHNNSTTSLAATTSSLIEYRQTQYEQLVQHPISKLLTDSETSADCSAACQSGRVCGRVFSAGDPSYQCHDCGMDATCVLCTDCFRQSQHVNHRHGMCVSLGLGGYCDCGDVEAWRAAPFCAAHAPQSSPAAAATAAAAVSVEDTTARHTLADIVLAGVVEFIVISLSHATRMDGGVTGDLSRDHVLVVYGHAQDSLEKVSQWLVRFGAFSASDARLAAGVLRDEGVLPIKLGSQTACTEALRHIRASGGSGVDTPALDKCVAAAAIVAQQRLCVRLLRHLGGLLEKQPELRPPFGAAILTVPESPVSGDRSPVCWLETLICMDSGLWAVAKRTCHLLFVHGLLLVPNLRCQFARVFVRWYAHVVSSVALSNESLESSVFDGSQTSVQDLSVQIFTVPSLAQLLLAECDALRVVIDPLRRECLQHAHDGGAGGTQLDAIGASQLSWQRFSRLLFASTTDAGYLLNNALQQQQQNVDESSSQLLSAAVTSIDEKVASGFLSGIECYIELLFLLEGVSSVRRQSGQHVLYERWHDADVAVSAAVAQVCRHVALWCAADRRLAIAVFKLAWDKWRRRYDTSSQLAGDIGSAPVETVSVAAPTGHDNDDTGDTTENVTAVVASASHVHQLSVSFVLPLTRLLAVLHLLLDRCGVNVADLVDVCSQSCRSCNMQCPQHAAKLHYRFLLEAPLRSLIVDQQVCGGQWRRNGQYLQIICYNYSRTSQCAELRDRDLQMLQVCAAHMHGDELIATLLCRSGAEDFINKSNRSDASRSDSTACVNNMADALLLLIQVMAERYDIFVSSDATPVRCLQKQVIQWLCMTPMTRSQLQDRLSGDVRQDALDLVLDRVAVFSSPSCSSSSASSPGLSVTNVSSAPPKYSLKPDYYVEYHSLWRRYSRRDRAKAELNMRSLWQRRQHGVCGVAALSRLPNWHQRLARIDRLFHSTFAVRVLDATLQNCLSSESSSGGVCELVLSRLLHLLAVLVHLEIANSATDNTLHSSDDAKFSTLARSHGLYGSLQRAVAHVDLSSESYSLLVWLVDSLRNMLSKSTLSPTKAETVATEESCSVVGSSASPADTSALSPPSSVSQSGSRHQIKRQLAAASRARMQRQMEVQQRRFLAQQQDEDSSTAESRRPPVKNTNVSQSAVLLDVDMSEKRVAGGQASSPVCLGAGRWPPDACDATAACRIDWHSEHCILCQSRVFDVEDGADDDSVSAGASNTTASDDPGHCSLVVCAYVQRSTVLVTPGAAAAAEVAPSHVSSCGHVMHARCCHRHIAVMSRDRHNTIRPTHLYGSDWRVGEYLCPLCQRLSNTVLPLLPQPGASSSLAIDPTHTAQIDFVEWLQCLEQFSSKQTQRAADGQQSIVSTSTSHTTADDLTGLTTDKTTLPVTTGSQANVAQQDELRQLSPLSIGILARFCKDTHKVLAGSLPVRSSVSAAETFIVAQTHTQSDSSTDSDSDSDTAAAAAVLSDCGVGACKSLVSVLRCCGYTFRCWERHLDGQNAAVLARPERGSLASLSLLARVAASVCVHRGGRSCGTPLLTGIASLLLALSRRQRPTRLAALTCDAFELMLLLTASLAAAQVARVSPKWRYISGSPEDQHVVRLCLLLCITQALLTSTNQRAPTTPVAMETDDVTSSADSDSQWLLEFYAHTSCMIQREADRISAADFLLHVWSFIRPFLRCCALVFHHMTGVQAPGDLTQSAPTWCDNASECRSLLCYLDIKLATVPVLCAVNLARRWMDQLAYCQTSSSGRSPASQSVQQALPPVASLIPNPRVRVVLIDLPQDYSDLILKATRVTCGCEAAAHSAKVSVSSPTLCLLCGAVLCSEVTCANPDSSSKLPRGRRPRGGMDGHALVCGAGVALFLVVRRCKLYLVHSTETSFRRAQVAPPYVDRFGESDEGLRRGVALSLRSEHMRRLCLLYSTHSVAAQVSRHVEDFTSRQMAMLD